MKHNRFIIKADRLFNGKDAVKNGDWVLVENGYIDGIGRGECPYGIVVHEFQDATILPGLIDAHVHLTMNGNADVILGDSVPAATLIACGNAERLIEAGITTVRDCGGEANIAVSLARAVEAGTHLRAPKIVACGPVLCITGGHGAFVGVEVNGVEQVRQAARTVISNGARFLKLIATGGVLTKGTNPGATQLDLDELSVAVHEAQKVGIRTAAHAHGTEGIRLSIQAGIDTIEHASYVDDAGVELFLKTGAYFVSTLLASRRQVEHPGQVPDYVTKKIQSHIVIETQSVSRLIREGIPTVAGTDAGSPFNPHGDLVAQLAILHELGMNRVAALRSATSLAAAALDVGGETGSLEKGKHADILIVRGNPAEDLGDLKHVLAVWRDGMKII